MLKLHFLILFVFLFPAVVIAEQAKIGVVIPLTGGASSNGKSISNSVQLADEKFDLQNNVEFIFEDDQMQPRQTVSAVRKFISKDKVDGLIVFGSPTSLAVNSIVESAKVPMIGMSVVDRVVEGKKYVVKHWVTAEKESKVLNQEIRCRDYKSVAIVSTTNDAMLKLRDLFVAGRAANIVLDQEFAPNDLDFRATVTRIKALNPDAVYILLWAPQPGVFTKQLRQGGYNGAIFGAHNIEDPDEIASANGALFGAWYVTGDDRAAIDYYRLYQDRYDTLPANGGINGFDSAKMVIEGIRSGNLNKYLHTIQGFKGAYGEYSATGSNDFDIPAAIKMIYREGFKFESCKTG